MAYPKWKYRRHPILGVFQATLVASAGAESELEVESEASWSDDPKSTGFEVRLARWIHDSHVVEDLPLHEVVTDASGEPILVDIAVTTAGDVHG